MARSSAIDTEGGGPVATGRLIEAIRHIRSGREMGFAHQPSFVDGGASWGALVCALFLMLIGAPLPAHAAQITPNPNPSGGTVTVSGSDENNENYTNNGTIGISASGTLTNTDVLSNQGTLSNLGMVNNTWSLRNSSMLVNEFGGTLVNTTNWADIWNYAGATLTNAGTLTNTNGARIVNEGTLSNSGTINNSAELENYDIFTNSGTLYNATNGELTNSGTLTNSGSIVNEDWIANSDILNNSGSLTSSGWLVNSSWATWTNTGTLTTSNIVYNYLHGTWINEAGASMGNSGIFYNWGDLQNNGMLTNTGSLNNNTFATLTNTGTLINSGTLNNSGSFGGSGTIVNDGGTIDNSGTMSITILAVNSGYIGTVTGTSATSVTTGNISGTLNFTGSDVLAVTTLNLITGVFNNNGSGTVDIGTAVVASGSTGTIGGTGAIELTTADVDGTLNVGAALTGTGPLTKTGSGVLRLSGANTYAGATAIDEGALSVDGSITSSVTVGAAGTLMGSGTVTGDVESYGLISPGNSPGTLTIAGNLYLGAGSTLFMEITPTASDLLVVSGTTTINGGTLSLDVAQGYYTSGQTFTLLTSAGGITGAFDTITIDDHSQFLVFTVDVGDTAITAGIGGSVSVTRLPYTMAGTSRNSMGAAAGLTGATSLATPSMQALLGTIDFTSASEVARGLRQMSPEPYSALTETAFSSMGLFSDTIRDRAYARRSGGETLLTAVSAGNIGRLTQLASAAGASDAGSGLSIKGTGTGMALFVKPVGQYQSVDNGHNRTGYQSWQYGVMAGGDAQVTDNFLAGFQVGWVHSDLRFKDDATSTGFSDAFLGGVYASATAGGFYADALAQAGAAVNHLDRRIEFGSISRRPTGAYTSFLFGASLSTGYEWTFGDFKAGPVGTLDYGSVSNPGFAESDPDLGLTVRGFTGNSLKTGLGAKVSGTFMAGETTTISPDLALRWGHEFLNDSRTISARYNGSPTSGFTSRTGDPARDSLLVDAGVSFGVSDSTKLYVRYSGQFLAWGVRTQAGAVGVRYEF